MSKFSQNRFLINIPLHLLTFFVIFILAAIKLKSRLASESKQASYDIDQIIVCAFVIIVLVIASLL